MSWHCIPSIGLVLVALPLLNLLCTWHVAGRTPGDLAKKYNQSDAFKVILQAKGMLPLEEED